MQISPKLKRWVPKPLRRTLRRAYEHPAETDWYWRVFSPGTDRTAYLIGLFGTGRLYVNDLMTQHIGERAKYFRDVLRLHRRPTSMIYSGHATLKYACLAQHLPSLTQRIFEAARARIADTIFLYRHPLDSLITNWVFLRTYLRTGTGLYVALAYKNTDDLCAVLEENFAEFEAFAAADPVFLGGSPGRYFLSFQEFVEETELYLQSASLTLRLEDFSVDPAREFSRIASLMSIDLNLNGSQISPPHTKPYRYLELKAKIPRFRSFIAKLDADTRRRIEALGYSVS